ncbi:MAG: phage holin family protein [Bacteroides sp.]|nr:phage holin family protein [Bacteroides sp.]MDD4719609.1 phage holin family protein [Bacteroides sp.]NLI64798.1 phage holin family protein [Bacteroidales bacterium]
MFSDNTITSIKNLFEEIKKYLSLQKEYTKLEITEKLTILFSALVLIIIFIILGMVALFFILLAIAYALAPYVGGLGASFLIIGVLYLILILFVYLLRKRLIISPIVNFTANLFLSDTDNKKQ